MFIADNEFRFQRRFRQISPPVLAFDEYSQVRRFLHPVAVHK